MTKVMIPEVNFMLHLFFGLAVVALLNPTASVFAQGNVAKAKNEQLQEVVAEGVGTTADEAIKDAFRNAVRQVVGAVVDAETLVKNDELIDDKVLTYSDGFIKGYVSFRQACVTGRRPFVSVDSWVFRNLGGLGDGCSNRGRQGRGTPAWERAVCRVAADSTTGHADPG